MRTLFLASEVRSGSTYIAELIAYNLAAKFGGSIWGLTKEPLQPLSGNADPAHVRRLLAELPVSHAGLRAGMIKRTHFEWIEALSQEDPEFEQIFFGPDTYWILVNRRDVLAQAVSLNCAICSDTYHAYTDLPVCEPCRATDDDLCAALAMIDGCDGVLDRIEARAMHRIRWCYEDVLKNEAALLDSVHRFLFGMDGGFATTALQAVKLVPCHSQAKASLRARLAARTAAQSALPRHAAG
jgi:hypothetical protein